MVVQSLKRVKRLKPGSSDKDFFEAFELPDELDPSYTYRVTFKQNSITNTVKWKESSNLPEPLRYKILPTKTFRQKGFRGGHLKEAWDETLSVYGDRIKVIETRRMVFWLANKVEIHFIRYQFDGVDIKPSKAVVVEGLRELRLYCKVFRAFSNPLKQSIIVPKDQAPLLTHSPSPGGYIARIPVMARDGSQAIVDLQYYIDKSTATSNLQTIELKTFFPRDEVTPDNQKLWEP